MRQTEFAAQTCRQLHSINDRNRACESSARPPNVRLVSAPFLASPESPLCWHALLLSARSSGRSAASAAHCSAAAAAALVATTRDAGGSPALEACDRRERRKEGNGANRPPPRLPRSLSSTSRCGLCQAWRLAATVAIRRYHQNHSMVRGAWYNLQCML